MKLHFNTFSIVLLMSGVTTLLVALLVFRRKGGVVRWFAVMMTFIAIWAIAYGIELSSLTLNQMLFWIDIEYIGIAFAPAAWIMFMIKFVGKDEWLTRRARLIIFSFPFLAVFFVWTNAWHNIHYESVAMDTSGPFPLLAIEPGPWYHVHTVYFYCMLFGGSVLLVNRFRTADKVYRRQHITILIGALIPWIANFTYLLGFRPYNHIDLTPYAFILTSLVIGLGLMRFRLLDIIPVAREKVLDSMREGMLVLDPAARIIDVNKKMKTFLLSRDKDLIGKSLSEVFPVGSPLHTCVITRNNDTLEVSLNDLTGTRFFDVDVTSLFENGTTFSGTLLIFWDTTERVAAEAVMKEQSEQLRVSNQMKDKLFSVISHDLRSPLASLVGMLELTASGQLSEAEFKSFLPTLGKDVQYTSSLLENLLQWSKTQLKGEVVKAVEFDLKEVMINKMLLFEKRATDKGITLKDETEFGTLLFADKDMIQLVLRNLISNAIKFCKRNDTISISATVVEGVTTIFVKDTGKGMSPETVAGLFGTETITTRGTNNEKGTGLGLLLCKEFVEKNGGSIWAGSEEGKGAEFSFTLPVHKVGINKS